MDLVAVTVPTVESGLPFLAARASCAPAGASRVDFAERRKWTPRWSVVMAVQRAFGAKIREPKFAGMYLLLLLLLRYGKASAVGPLLGGFYEFVASTVVRGLLLQRCSNSQLAGSLWLLDWSHPIRHS